MSSPGTGCSSRVSLLQFSCIAPLVATACAEPDVDFRVSEVVDLTQVVTGYIPKDIFLR